MKKLIMKVCILIACFATSGCTAMVVLGVACVVGKAVTDHKGTCTQ
jgi:hypothetical protein